MLKFISKSTRFKISLQILLSLFILILIVSFICFFSLRKTIKSANSINDIPFKFPDYVVNFPSKGSVSWGVINTWSDEYVIWGHHNGVTDVMEWRNNFFRANKKIPDWVDNIAGAHQANVNSREPRYLRKYIDERLNSSEKFLEDIPNNISIPPPKYIYGERIIVSRNIDGSERRFIEVYITKEYFFIYFSHFRSKAVCANNFSKLVLRIDRILA
ncbi:MAG: hypothetical protein LBC02_03620, partial [Planctomycetaceae bacterium]|nr:hypothetical protein [Planctomycetaceae bacterium]